VGCGESCHPIMIVVTQIKTWGTVVALVSRRQIGCDTNFVDTKYERILLVSAQNELLNINFISHKAN
jgi:hypothetical protein